jgi:hypothetical protein
MLQVERVMKGSGFDGIRQDNDGAWRFESRPLNGAEIWTASRKQILAICA